MVRIKTGEGRQPPNYSEFSHVESAIPLGVGVINTAAGTALGAAVLLKDMIAEYGGGGVGRKWNVDSPLGGPTQHLTGYYHKYRAELDSNEVTVHDLRDLAVAYPEFPVSNTFEIIMGSPAAPPDEMTARERAAYGIRRYDPDDGSAVRSASPHIRSALDRHDQPIYAAHNVRGSVTVKSDGVPADLREKYPDLDWDREK